MAGGGGGGDGEPEFQIAPMIDVLLVLLIFFMTITSAEVLKVDKKLTLPVSPNAKKRDPEFSKHEMAVNLRWNEAQRKADLVIDDKIYEDKQEVVPYLEERKKADEKLRVIIRGDKGLPAIEVQRLMNLLAEAGLSDISFAASNK
jgi:biopolymer transport protein ExbD